MEDANTIKRPSSLPANYVTILELKERWLEKERQQKEKERQQKEEEQRQEEELRQQKLREEEASKPPKSIIVVQNSETDFKPRGRSFRAKYRPANPSVSEAQGVELDEKKGEEPAWEKERKKKKKKIRGQMKKKEIRARMDMEGKADAPIRESCEKGSDQARGSKEKELQIEIRAKNENVEVVEKFKDLSVSFESGKGNDDSLKRLRRVVRRGNGEIRAKSENVGQAVEVVQKFRDLSVNGEAGKGDENFRKTSRVNRRRNGRIRAKSENVIPAVEVVEKFSGLSVSGEAGKGDDDNLSRPTKVDRRGNGGFGSYRKVGRSDVPKRGSGMVWVKKGEVADGNGGGVRCSVQGRVVSGQTGTSSNAGSSAGKMRKNYAARGWSQHRREPELVIVSQCS